MPYYSLLPILERKRLEKNNLVLSLQIRLSLLVGLITPYYILLLLITHTYDSLLGLITPYYSLLPILERKKLEKNNLVLSLQIRT